MLNNKAKENIKTGVSSSYKKVKDERGFTPHTFQRKVVGH